MGCHFAMNSSSTINFLTSSNLKSERIQRLCVTSNIFNGISSPFHLLRARMTQKNMIKNPGARYNKYSNYIYYFIYFKDS